MIQSPITKTGQIRYVELIKIGVLVSFFYAFFSFVTDEYFVLSGTTTLVVGNVFNIIVFSMVLVSSYTETKELIRIIKSFMIEWIILPVVELKETVIEVVTSTVRYIENKFQKLCVIRC